METLEDDFTYVTAKALRGHALSPSAAANLAGLTLAEVQAFLAGEFSEKSARQLANALGLQADALADHPNYLPKPLEISQIRRLNLPFDHEQVNAWQITAGEISILFDTGFTPGSCAEKLSPPRPAHLFITHSHRDHIGGLASLLAMGIPAHGANIPGARPMIPGETLTCGPLSIRACDLSGHATPALGYHITGLEKAVLVTGDALFAGSIGSCASPTLYRHAIERLHEVLAPLPPTTILLPGHGPATTLAEERHSNPFLCKIGT